MDAINTVETTGDYVDHAKINIALKKFFENDENHSFVATLEEETIPAKKKRTRKPRPEPTVHELCKEMADQNFKLPEVRRAFGISEYSGRPSRKKAVPRIKICDRSRSMHKLNPEELTSRII